MTARFSPDGFATSALDGQEVYCGRALDGFSRRLDGVPTGAPGGPDGLPTGSRRIPDGRPDGRLDGSRRIPDESRRLSGLSVPDSPLVP